MRVFISWSGDLSKSVACTLREWLPGVIQAVQPYVSSEDIDKGKRWSTEVANELERANYGIIVVTKENVGRPWLNFEAGALSRVVAKTSVTPFLFRISQSEVRGPLLQFQSTSFSKEDVHKLLASMNGLLEDEQRLAEARLRSAFDKWWPDLEAELDGLPETSEPSGQPQVPAVSDRAIMEELLELARSQQRILADPELLLPYRYLRSAMRGLVGRDPRLYRGALHDEIAELDRSLSKLSRENPDLEDLASTASMLHSKFHELTARSHIDADLKRRNHRSGVGDQRTQGFDFPESG
ncbi:hypothetical protein [Maioricimonas sp. JC845]|uniref:TIR domain-containing protein n=1 Tax=Maioricimonas sp. JC845 TaxID=3232138 RepID=UPI00345A9092